MKGERFQEKVNVKGKSSQEKEMSRERREETKRWQEPEKLTNRCSLGNFFLFHPLKGVASDPFRAHIPCTKGQSRGLRGCVQAIPDGHGEFRPVPHSCGGKILVGKLHIF